MDFQNKTTDEVFNHGLGVSWNKPCLGYRPINLSTGDFENFHLWQTYSDIDKRRTDFGSGIIKLFNDGLLGPGDIVGTTIGIWTHNRPGKSQSLSFTLYSCL